MNKNLLLLPLSLVLIVSGCGKNPTPTTDSTRPQYLTG